MSESYGIVAPQLLNTTMVKKMRRKKKKEIEKAKRKTTSPAHGLEPKNSVSRAKGSIKYT